MSFLAAAGIMGGSSLLGGILGRKDQRDAANEQRSLGREAIARNERLADQFRSQADAALGQQRVAVDLLAGLPQSIRQGFDAATTTELNRLAEQRQQERARMQAQMGAAGMGGTTVAAQMRRALDRMIGRGFADTSARFAQGRAGAVAGAVGMQAGAQSQLAGMTADYAAREAAIRQFAPQLLANTQVMPPNTGAQIGQFGAGLASLYQMDIMAGMFSNGIAPQAAALDSLSGLRPGEMGPPLPPQFTGF